MYNPKFGKKMLKKYKSFVLKYVNQ